LSVDKGRRHFVAINLKYYMCVIRRQNRPSLTHALLLIYQDIKYRGRSLFTSDSFPPETACDNI